MSQQLPTSWYYIQVFFEGEQAGHSNHFVVIADNKISCIDKCHQYIKKNYPGKKIANYRGMPELHLYKNNYKPDSRRLIAAGKVI